MDKISFKDLEQILLTESVQIGSVADWLKILEKYGWTQEEYLKASIQQIKDFEMNYMNRKLVPIPELTKHKISVEFCLGKNRGNI